MSRSPSVDIHGIDISGRMPEIPIGTAFDKINTRRMLLYIEKTVSQYLENNMFELNDRKTMFGTKNVISSLLRNVCDRRGIVDYQVHCDESNNTSFDIDNGILNVDIMVKPTIPCEYINMNFVVSRAGCSFAELSEVKYIVPEHLFRLD